MFAWESKQHIVLPYSTILNANLTQIRIVLYGNKHIQGSFSKKQRFRGWLNLDKFQKEITHRKWLDLGDGAGSLFCLLTINIPSIVDSVQELTEENVAQDEKLFQNRYVSFLKQVKFSNMLRGKNNFL